MLPTDATIARAWVYTDEKLSLYSITLHARGDQQQPQRQTGRPAVEWTTVRSIERRTDAALVGQSSGATIGPDSSVDQRRVHWF